MQRSHHAAFTLAEILIALGILGVIATFTIPKVLQAQQSNQFKSIGKEAASALSGAYEAFRLEKTPTATTASEELLAYINYVKLDSAGTYLIDREPNEVGSLSCAATRPCVFLHNGSVLMALNETFGGTSHLDFIGFLLDPDGKESEHRAMKIYVYYNGRISTKGDVIPAANPNWFSWD